MPNTVINRRIYGSGGNNNTSFTLPSTPFSLYSLRQYSGYGGPCVKVRRDSDNATSNIYFSSGIINETTLLNFVGAGDGFIECWYDQSGFGNHLNQSAAIYQPKIVNGGAMILGDNGLHTVDFGPAGNGMNLETPIGFLNGITELSLFGVWDITTSNNEGVFGPSTVNSQGIEMLSVNSVSRPTYLRINGTLRNDNAGAAYQMWNSGSATLTTFLGNSTLIDVRKNGISISLTDASAMPALNFNGKYALGLYFNVGNSMEGSVQELIIFQSDQTSNSATIESGIITYYSL